MSASALPPPVPLESAEGQDILRLNLAKWEIECQEAEARARELRDRIDDWSRQLQAT